MPDLRLPMTENYRHHAIGAYGSPRLGEGASDKTAIMFHGAVIVDGSTAPFDDDFICLFLDASGVRRNTEVGMSGNKGALEPNIEDVGRVRVVNHVVVGRIGNDRVQTCGWHRKR